ncbi:Ribosomal protein S18 acetylase RimI [Halorubrum aquaticum]|uniref:Ribosomal protein S18 acetylase RimI n=1 Tax=Halorubrum aquaticum TaxID=387340 RepID=A0A1I3A4Q0_9EURY|nr:GNAT family N-acetyltransferase [Halorubrum aquaticum]SFH44261.1 Ribosomal protein S18 acetylase RimI [Halorubrum aquaticum]
MNVRPAESTDRERIRAIARDSLRSSYSLSPEQIETMLEEEFDDASLADLLDDAETAVLVVEEEVDGTETVRGFITVEIGTKATIRWLHVDPAARGGGIATALLERVRERFAEKPIAACILDEAVEGGEFLEGFGLEQGDHERILIGGEEFAVIVYTAGQSTETSTEPTVTVPEVVAVDGGDRPVDHDDSVPGSMAPFFTVYSADDEEDAYGYFCSQCGGTNVSTDGQDRLECGNCGNVHLADEWDDAYL